MNMRNLAPFYQEMLRVWQEMDKCRHFEENKNIPLSSITDIFALEVK